MIRLTLDSVEPITSTIRSYHFLSEKPIRYEAGQFIELLIPEHTPQEGEMKHWFTLSSSPSEPYLSITTRFIPHHLSQYKQILHNLKPGSQLLATDPMGDFVLPLDKRIQLVFVAIGMGITPVRSMVKWLVDTDERRDIRLLYATADDRDSIFHTLFASYGLDATYIAKHAPTDWEGETGRLDTKRILKLTQPQTQTLFYISGPELMVEQLTHGLADEGISPLHVVSDYFPGYSPI